ncbi:MAG: hypothetical protein IJM92_02125 [Fibrobacter sp.]|uniref:hypothetical protein n=1 Tax=Fibrobacter sp. TaxID=35828 RepID=UPI0025C66704|nr:hypothetical protein [Fibrobacter sp.]MBQ7078469.1 hypothetical protein [Fibrobacter sp.]
MKTLRGLFMASAMIGCAYAQNLVSVEAFDEQGNNPSQLTLRLKLTNKTSDTLNDVHARYFLNYDRNKVLNVSPYYMAGATTSIDTLGNFLVVNINVAKLAPGVFPNADGISLGMNYADWSAFNKQDNFSYPNASSFVISNKIPVYANGAVVAGVTPVNTPVNVESPKIRFVGIQPENTATRSAWVELQNYGTTDIDLSSLFLKWTASDSVGFGNLTLPAGKKVRICQSSSLECPVDDKVVVDSHYPIGLEKNIVLAKGTLAIDSIQLGTCKQVSYTCLRTIIESEKTGVANTYSLGKFFKFVENVGWNIYSAGEINGDSDALPMAQPYVLPSSAFVAIDKNKKARLAWIPVKGAKSYVVSVYKKNDKSLVARRTVQNNFVELDLSKGAYLWSVASYAKNGNQIIESQRTYGANGENEFYALPLDEQDIRLREKKLINVVPFAARKDTRLLDPLWGSLSKEREWNKEHLDHESFDEEEENRCWAVAANMLNHYYGGTMTQDEIKIYGMKKEYPNGGALYYFRHGEEGFASTGTLIEVLHYLFGEAPTMGFGMPSLATVKNALNRPVPDPIIVAISWEDKGNHQITDDEVPGHQMVIDGYAVLDQSVRFADGKTFEAGTVLYHFLNWDNNGTSYWMPANSFNYDFYLIAENRYRVGTTDYRVKKDSDEDGVMDYDELERFGSNAYHDDSDKDKLRDFDEIYAFVKPCVADPEVGCESFKYFDSDGDKFPTYWDWDSDNGGESDGSEVKAGRNMFDEGDDVSEPHDITWDLPSDITIYSLDAMRVNDRTVCRDGEGYCTIASESGRVDFAINIGVESVVGNVYSRGGVWLRSRSEVKGDIHTYFDQAGSHFVNIQEGAKLGGKKVPHAFSEWTHYVWSDDQTMRITNIELMESMVVAAGEEKTLKNGKSYSSVKVESGGTLKIEPGDKHHIGNIQFESGSTIMFVNPGQQTVIEADGKIIWRTTISNEDKELVAKGFKLIQYSDKNVKIEGDWAGTIHAARSSLVMGQTNKLMYGRFLAKLVTIHQESKIYRVDFNPITPSTNLAGIYQVDFDLNAQSTNLALR